MDVSGAGTGRRRWTSVAAVAALALVAACTGADDRPGDAASPQEEPAPAASPTSRADTSAAATSTPTPTGSPPGNPGTSPQEPPHPVSVEALVDREYDGRGLRVGRALVRTDAYTQHFVTYRSDGLRISGVLNLPHGSGPFPAVVLAHGYIDPAIYVNGQGLRREQDWLARSGYIVLHTDYRNHAASDEDPRADVRLRLDYAADVVNAVRALRRSDLGPLDRDRVALLGRSMGGGVVYNALVARPGLVDAAVVFAPVSSLAADNFNRWIRDDAERSGLSRRILDRYGAPEENPGFWRAASPRPYFHRVTEPVLIHHGTADESCPIRWSRQTLRAMKRQGADARLITYPGEPHAFAAAWPRSMRRTERFLERHLG